MRIIKTSIPAILMSMLFGCAAPVTYTTNAMTRLDKDTEYSVSETGSGFDLVVVYSRYQFIPESAAVATACKAALMSTAWEVAKQRGKKISPVNEQRMKLSMGRNGVTGITSCSATAPVEWQS